jgi:hypothetical protein
MRKFNEKAIQFNPSVVDLQFYFDFRSIANNNEKLMKSVSQN